MENQEDNRVDYYLFPAIESDEKLIDWKNLLKHLKDSYLAAILPIISEYIWQNESFQLSIRIEENHGYLYGRTTFNDNIEDEWLIVYLLYELTKKNKGLVIKTWDNDGEFLLIEATNNLPKWLESDEKAKNKVYIYEGNLHIIPRHVKISSVFEGSKYVRENSIYTIASQAIQNDINIRIQEFPEKTKKLLHIAHCYIPACLAAVLDFKPQLITPIIDSFWNRDPLDMRKCITMKYFRPGTRIKRAIKMSKCQYAQLIHQNFNPDKRSGWNLPQPNTKKFKEQDLGVKLSYGAEILSLRSNKQLVPAQGILQNDKRWKNFSEILNKNGFIPEKTHDLYLNRYKQAELFYQTFIQEDDFENGNVCNPGNEILNLITNLDYDIEKMRLEEVNIIPQDNDEWLDLSPEKLDQLFNKITGGRETTSELDVLKLPKVMKNFLNKIGSIEGALADVDIDFHPNEFMKSLQEMDIIGKHDDEISVSSTDSMDEYGESQSDDDMNCYSSKPCREPKKNFPKDDLKMKEIMELMDNELSTTEIGKSFIKVGDIKSTDKNFDKQGKNIDSSNTDDEFNEIDVDMNVVKNLLDSYAAQTGSPGPTSNILGSMNIKLPK